MIRVSHIRIKASDGTVLPVISSVSNEIGPEGRRVEFQLADVILDVPQGALLWPLTISTLTQCTSMKSIKRFETPVDKPLVTFISPVEP